MFRAVDVNREEIFSHVVTCSHSTDVSKPRDEGWDVRKEIVERGSKAVS